MTQLIEIEKAPGGYKAMLPDRAIVEAKGQVETAWEAAKLIGDVIDRRVFSANRVANGQLWVRFFGEPFEKTKRKEVSENNISA